MWPLILIATLAGGLPLRSHRVGPIAISLPIVLLAQHLSGFPLAVACGLLARLADAHRRQRHAPLSPGRWGYELSQSAIAVTLGAVTYSWIADVGPAGMLTSIVAMLGFSLMVVGVDTALSHLRRFCVQQSAPFSRTRLWARGVEVALALATVPFLANLYSLSGGARWIWVTLFALLGFAGGVAYGRRRATRAALDETTHDVHDSIARALAHSLVVEDRELRHHLDRVRELCKALARRFSFTPPECRSLSMAAILHDVGKIAVPRRILDKPARLDADEWRQVRMHPGVGAEIISSIDFPQAVQDAVRHHHERWDGTGYPDGLAGDEIPLGARILSAVDCYDALVSDRPYRAAYTESRALDYLNEQSGHMFDPTVVEALVDHLRSNAAAVGSVEIEETDDETFSMKEREAYLCTLYDMERIADYELGEPERWTLLSANLRKWLPHRTLVVFGTDDE
ncbi:MAG: HD-GYP domain-containing protein, partial [Acidobacteriota bacterium]|nr:HD-GYP domain-containing protein [Acidobacteriota bacterium]